MLLRTLFLLALLATLGETLLVGANAFAKVALRRDVALALRQQIASATTRAQMATQAVLRAGGDPRALWPVAPAPQPTCVLAAADGCRLEASATIAFAPMPAPAASATPCADGACTIYLQGNDALDEGRIVATIAATVTGPSGAPLGARATTAVFRTSRDAPYAILSGFGDASIASLAGRPVGDDGGAMANGAAPGTLFDVTFENALTGARLAANVWQPQLERPAPVAPPWLP